MVRQAAVGIEKAGKLRVQLDRSVSPDDTLPLTKSILAGARKDFPGRPFVLSVYDPQGEPVLRARVAGDGEVRDEVVHDESGSARRARRHIRTRSRGPAGPRPIASSPNGPRSTDTRICATSRPTWSGADASGSA